MAKAKDQVIYTATECNKQFMSDLRNEVKDEYTAHVIKAYKGRHEIAGKPEDHFHENPNEYEKNEVLQLLIKGENGDMEISHAQRGTGSGTWRNK